MQLIKFGIVAVIATIIDLAVLMILKEYFNVGVLWASALAFSVSVLANYVLSMLFVFESKVGIRVINSFLYLLNTASNSVCSKNTENAFFK